MPPMKASITFLCLKLREIYLMIFLFVSSIILFVFGTNA